jgi:hypothetical protein
MPAIDEVVVPFRVSREHVRPTSEFKSTWLTASLETARERGHFERYLEALPAQYHEPILRSIAGTWLPVEVCLAHYRAMNALSLPFAEQIAMGRGVLDRLQKTIFSLGFRAARDVGVTPWTILKLFPSQFEREWRDGACGIFRMGPKDARMELIGFPCSAIPYARNGLRGVALGLTELVCTKAYVSEVRELCTDMTMAFRIAWA